MPNRMGIIQTFNRDVPQEAGGLSEKQPMVGKIDNSDKRPKVGTSVESVEMSLPSSQS
jgi:hypothetical protein